jgi:hypothetical protein
MALSFPREAFMEMYFPGRGWVDVTSQVRQISPVTITRGRGNEQGKVAPSKLTAVMENDDGNMSPGNPMGDYYGLLGRNTPVRWGLTVARDAFGDAVVNGWGTADVGGAWSVFGASSAASDWNVAAGKGTMSIDAAGETRSAYLAGEVHKNVEVRYSVSVPFSNVTGESIRFRTSLRAQSTSGPDYRVTVTVNTSEVVFIEIDYFDGALLTTIVPSTTITGLAFTGSLNVACQIDGSTLRAKVWAGTAADEPYAWHVEGSDPANLLADAGTVQITAVVVSGNTNTKPIVFSYDNYSIRLIRFSGELADLKPRWNENHTDKWASLEAAGIMRRLHKGTKPASTAIERYVLRNAIQPLAYWPLDDGNLSTTGRIAAGSGRVAVINIGQDNSPGLAFGTGDAATWLKPVASISHDRFLNASLGPGTGVFVGSYTAHVMFSNKGGIYTDSGNSDGIYFGAGGVGVEAWVLSVDSFNGDLKLADPNGVLVATLSDTSVFDDKMHHIGLRSTQNGANIDWVFYLDGASVASGTMSSFTSAISRVAFQQNTFQRPDNGKERCVGHIIIYSGTGPSVSEIYDAMFGHVGEAAGRRIERLCNEEAISFSHVGDLDDTPAMGPQYPTRIVDLLQGCADVTQGTLYEPRATIGLALRTRDGTENQSGSLTLDYAAGNVSYPLEPTHDDQNTVNRYTAERLDGGEYEAAQLSGSLNVNDPGTDPDGAGENAQRGTFNVETDDQLPAIAERVVARGTVKEDRYPKIRVDLSVEAIDGTAALEAAILAVDVDDRLVVENLSDADIFEPIDQLARGYTEVFRDEYSHEITFNTAPFAPYRIFVLDSSRLDGGASTLAEALDTTETGVDVASTGALWTTTGGEFPFDVTTGGERLPTSAISGASSPQTFTVTRAGNDVVKPHDSGGAVLLADPDFLG